MFVSTMGMSLSANNELDDQLADLESLLSSRLEGKTSFFEDKRGSSLNGLGDDMVMNQLANLFDNIQGL